MGLVPNNMRRDICLGHTTSVIQVMCVLHFRMRSALCADREGIDFLLLDATHVLPGEMLAVIVCLPYLKQGEK